MPAVEAPGAFDDAVAAAAATRSVCDFAARLACAAVVGCDCYRCYCDGPLAAVTLIVTDLGTAAAGVSSAAVAAAAGTPVISAGRARWRTFCSWCHRGRSGRRSSARRNSCRPEGAVAFSDD